MLILCVVCLYSTRQQQQTFGTPYIHRNKRRIEAVYTKNSNNNIIYVIWEEKRL